MTLALRRQSLQASPRSSYKSASTTLRNRPRYKLASPALQVGFDHAGLPARLDDAGQRTFERIFAQAQPAHLEAPIKRARPSAQRASIIRAHLELGLARRFNSQAGLRHLNRPLRRTQ